MAFEPLQLPFDPAQGASNHAPARKVANTITRLSMKKVYRWYATANAVSVPMFAPVNPLYCRHRIFAFDFAPGSAGYASNLALGTRETSQEQLGEGEEGGGVGRE